MSTNRRRRGIQRRSGDLSERRRFFLLLGHDFDFFEGEPFESIEDALGTWRRHRRALLAEFIMEHPGRRPWAWWTFAAVEPRRLIRGWCKPVSDELWFGIPRVFETKAKGEADSTWPRWELERDYLERLNLLTNEERGLTNEV